MSEPIADPGFRPPALARLRIRLASLVYEALLLVALLMVATALFVAIAGDSRTPLLRHLLRIYLVAVMGVYFVWSWSHGRRTLAMRTWRLRLVDRAGAPPGLAAACVRFLVAAAAAPLAALPWWWAGLDRDRLFLHDRVAGTRLLRDPPPQAGRNARASRRLAPLEQRDHGEGEDEEHADGQQRAQ